MKIGLKLNKDYLNWVKIKALIIKKLSPFLIIFIFFQTTLGFSFFDPDTMNPSGIYELKGKESLSSLLEKRLSLPKELTSDEQFLNQIKSDNPHIKNWSEILKGEKVYLEIPLKFKDFITLKDGQFDSLNKARNLSEEAQEKLVKAYIAERMKERKETKSISMIMEEEKKKKEIEWKKMEEPLPKDNFPKAPKSTIGFGLFYMASIGNLYDNSRDNTISSKTEQNSPVTGGAFFHIKTKHDRWISGSFYYSTITETVATQIDEVTTPPPEYGGNLYYNFPFDYPGLSFYWGADYENFSTYNLNELQSGASLDVRTHTISYLTLGASKRLFWFDKNMLFKASISQVFTSSSNEDITITENYADYRGYKYMIYYSYFFENFKNMSLNLMYKSHYLNGTRKIQIDRYGIGLGLSLF